MIDEHFEEYLVRTTSFSNKHQRRKFRKPNNLPVISEIETVKKILIGLCIAFEIKTYKMSVKLVNDVDVFCFVIF